MKTLKTMMIVLLLLMANVTIAQAINYPTYSNTVHVVYYGHDALAPGYQAGDEVFQTSNLTPLVDEDGYAVEPYSEDNTSTANGPRRSRGDGGSGNGGTPGSEVEDGRLPIGSVLVLLLLALCHVAYIAYANSARKQK